MNLGMPELILIFVVVLLLFGAKRLPEIAKSMGKAVNEFKKTKDGFMDYKDESETKKTDDQSEESPKDVPPPDAKDDLHKDA